MNFQYAQPAITGALLLCALISGCFLNSESPATSGRIPKEEKFYPGDIFFAQRSFPDSAFDYRGFRQSLDKLINRVNERSTFRGFDLEWISQGPGNIGARVNTIAVHPANEQILYAGYAHGGVFKTENGGQSWSPVFDSQPYLSIGHVTIDPNNPERVYVGTGDVNIPSGFFLGDGVYKSDDGGNSWENIGLRDKGIISKIIVDPSDADVLYVGAMGIPSVRDNNRGLYKSEDRGETWEQVLFVNEQAGIIDIIINPGNPEVLYAASWDRYRTNFESLVSGSNAGIWKTTDGGETWTKLETGLPAGELGRIGLTMSGSNPDILFSVIVNSSSELEGIYKTVDGGENWFQITDIEKFREIGEDEPLGGFGWYFGKVRVNPDDDNDIMLLGVDLFRTLDGGETWFMASPPWWSYQVHADKHDLIYLENGEILLTTDGGIYKYNLLTTEWEDIENIVATQFYRVAYNPHQPDWYYGGAQDNGTSGGNALFINFWERIYGGDGFQAAFHPFNPDIMFAETQNGNLIVSEDGGFDWNSADMGLEGDRKNWDMPYLLSPHNPDIIYAGTYRIMKSFTGSTPFFEALTGDLTAGIDDRYYTISSLDESVIKEGLLYVGTSDGKVRRVDGLTGEVFDISDGLPLRYVTSVKASPDNTNTVFVTHSGYKYNEYIPHIHKSEDQGTTWEDITADLPDVVVNDVFILPGHEDSILFVGTDVGVYGSLNGGASWERLGTNMPHIPVFDLVWNEAKNELVAGTYARGIMSYQLDEIDSSGPTSIKNTIASKEKPFRIFPNPARESCTIEFFNTEPGKSAEIAIIDAQGRLVFNEKVKTQGKVIKKLDISGYAKGKYHVKVKIRHQVKTAGLLIL